MKPLTNRHLLSLILAENLLLAAALAVTSDRMRRVLALAEQHGIDAARSYLEHPTARQRIAKVARGVAKDYLQERAEQRGEPWQP